MEKTSREYAEKLAEEMQPDIEGKNYTLYNMLAQEKRHNIVIGYLKAVEETNVKELREALEKARDLIDYFGNESYMESLDRKQIVNALNKTKS